MFETFCLRLAAGLVLALLLLPRARVQPRFYRIHLLIVLGVASAAGVAAWNGSAELYWLALGLGVGAGLIGTLAWSLEGAPAGYLCLCVTLAALLTALTTGSTASGSGPAELAGTFLDEGTAAALLGVTTTAMLMGHWYLIAPTMSLQPLLRLLAVYFICLGLRSLVAAVGLWQWTTQPTWAPATDQVAWLWLALRWGAGFVGPVVLGWMTWQTARMRSTQSATGILYVVVIFVFLGELTSLLLRAHTGYCL